MVVFYSSYTNTICQHLQIFMDIPHLPKESFQILRQLRPAGVAWIHRDEDAHRRNQVHFLTHEVKAFLLIPNGILDTFDLINTTDT